MNANRFFWDSHWLEIWSNHFYPSMGPNGGSVAMDSGESVNFMTPSLESPGQWSNNSPQSHSDWIDNNIHSPPNSFQQHPFQQQQQLQQQQQFKQQQDAFVI
jgi:hypothetical protein